MNDNPILIFAESTVTYALFNRCNNFFPEKSDDLYNLLSSKKWGQLIIKQWKNPTEFKHLYNALNEDEVTQMDPLISIFSEVHIQQKCSINPRYYEPIQWRKPVYNPILQDPPSEEQIKKHWNSILNAWEQFIEHAPDNDEIRISYFLDWADQWLSSIPMSQKYQSIPLATHLRLMHALSIACGRESKSFKLLLGDISGIQSYLFDIAHIGAGKVAKRLRARSFTLGLLADVASHEILLEADLPISNLLLSAGGVFYILLPSTFDIGDWKKNTNKFLYERFQGAITLHSSIKDIQLKDISNQFPKFLSTLYEGIQESKSKPFDDLLQLNESWDESVFVHESKNNRDDPCDSCRKFPKVNGEFCEYCLHDGKIGTKLTRTNFLLFKKGKGTIQFGNIGVDLLEQVPASIEENSYLLQVWNKAESENSQIPFQRKWVANYIPVAPKGGCKDLAQEDGEDFLYEGEPLTFGYMAHYGQGKDLLGYLKADVDNLGMLFTVGFIGDKDDQPHTFSHIATLSKMFERFFAGGINDWLHDEYKYTYTVFSGGDDLFLIGPWDETLKAAQEIRSKFKAFVGANPEVTLSAGINILKPKFPLPHSAQYVERELEKGKEEVNRIRIQEGNNWGRDQISVQGFVMDWTHFKVVKDTSKMLSKWWNQNKLSSSLIYQLGTFSEMYTKYKDSGQIEYLKFIPLMEYTIQRNLIEGKVLNPNLEPSDQEILDWLKNLQNVLHQKNKHPLRSNADLLWGYMRLFVKLSSYYREG